MIVKKKRIAVVVPGGLGTGPENIGVPVMQEIVERLARDFDITVFSLFAVNENYQPGNFRIVSVPGRTALLRAIRVMVLFSREHRKTPFQIVHGFWAMPSGVIAVLIGKIFKIRSIVSILGGDVVSLSEINYGHMRSPFRKRVVMKCLAWADEVISLTGYLISNLAYHGFYRKNIRIIPWGIDVARFKFRAFNNALPLKFLHIASLAAVKDQVTLLRAFEIIHKEVSSELVIVGEGPMETALIEMIDGAGLTECVSIRKPVPYNQVHEFYNQSDVLLHTSLSEGQSEVVTEAMSSGLIVCGTSVGLLFDIPECCLSVTTGDYHALAAGVLELLKQPDRIEEIRTRAREWTTYHSLTWTVKQMASLYDME